MYQFFNVDSADDLKLLHKSIRTNTELENIVEQIQWQIIEAFSQRDMQGLTTYEAFFKYEFGDNPRDVIKVRLLGYNEDDPEESEAGLKEAFRRTIAKIASWVLRNYSNPQDVRRIKQGQREVEYSGTVPTWENFPKGWDRLFKNYDARIQPYGI